MSVTDLLRTVDRFQQRRRVIGFVAAVIKKFTDDQAGQQAALLAFYGFLSLFPLLLVLVSVLGFVLQGNPGEQTKILNGTLGQFPFIRDALQGQSLTGSGVALGVGTIGALLAGLGITNATQNAFNRIWHVPFKHRPNFIKLRLRSLGLLAVLGVLSIVSTTAAGFVSAATHGALATVGGVVVALLANLALFMATFRLLTAAAIQTRDLVPGVIVATILWQLLQHLGGYYVSHQLKHVHALYSTFAVVLGLVLWLYLGAQMLMFAAEVNVVRAWKLWPRSFFPPPLTEADKRALVFLAEVEERVHGENVEVTFGPPGGPGAAGDPGAAGEPAQPGTSAASAPAAEGEVPAAGRQ